MQPHPEQIVTKTQTHTFHHCTTVTIGVSSSIYHWYDLKHYTTTIKCIQQFRTYLKVYNKMKLDNGQANLMGELFSHPGKQFKGEGCLVKLSLLKNNCSECPWTNQVFPLQSNKQLSRRKFISWLHTCAIPNVGHHENCALWEEHGQQLFHCPFLKNFQQFVRICQYRLIHVKCKEMTSQRVGKNVGKACKYTFIIKKSRA